jgi:very-short-patch-repair endonuclease
MGVKFIELAKIRLKRWNKENRVANKLNIKSLSIELLKERRTKLNESRFKSELWFQSKLELLFRDYKYLVIINKNYNLLNKFFADFYFIDRKIAIEIDGSVHDGKESYDNWRDEMFKKAGIRVIRIRAYDEVGAEKCLKFLAGKIKDRDPKHIQRRDRNRRKKQNKKSNSKSKEQRKINPLFKMIARKEKITRMEFLNKKRQAEILWSLGKGPSPYLK